jgi:hypothetical protein
LHVTNQTEIERAMAEPVHQRSLPLAIHVSARSLGGEDL